MKKPKYSICMCNYNMEDTLESALTSILEQLDSSFEVVVVDDGSTDQSVEILKKLMTKYSILRLVELKRDRKRKLGITRNISVDNAFGEYVLLHIDCDDHYDPFIKDFATVFHLIEKCLKKDVLVSGKHVNMGKKSFLQQHGPYRNIFYTEDRDMWSRMAFLDAFVPLEHIDFVKRLPLTNKKRIFKSVWYTFIILRQDFCGGVSLPQFFRYEINRKNLSLKLRLYRIFIALPAFILSKFKDPIPNDQNLPPEEFAKYRSNKRGTVQEIARKNGCALDVTFLSDKAKKIFLINS